MAAVRRHAHERLGHEAGDQAELARHLRADLAVGREPVGGAQGIVVGEIELELARRVLVVALDHVEAHLAGVFDHPHRDRAQALELVDMVAVGLRGAAGGVAGLVLLQPHHLGLAAHAQLHAMLLAELGMVALEVAAAVGAQEAAGLVVLLAIAEADAEHARHPLVPGQLAEGLGIGDADQLGRLGPVADILAVPVGEQVGGRAVDELEALLGGALPMVGGDALADDAAGDRDELVVDVGDAQLVDLLADLLDQLGAPVGADILVDRQLRHLHPPPCWFRAAPPQLHGNGLFETGCSRPAA